MGQRKEAISVKHYYFWGIPFEMFFVMLGFGVLLGLIVYSAYYPLRRKRAGGG